MQLFTADMHLHKPFICSWVSSMNFTSLSLHPSVSCKVIWPRERETERGSERERQQHVATNVVNEFLKRLCSWGFLPFFFAFFCYPARGRWHVACGTRLVLITHCNQCQANRLTVTSVIKPNRWTRHKPKNFPSLSCVCVCVSWNVIDNVGNLISTKFWNIHNYYMCMHVYI